MAHLDKLDGPQQAPSKQNLVEELAQLEKAARTNGHKILANILWLAKTEAGRDRPQTEQINISE
jgi:hypothetical protein